MMYSIYGEETLMKKEFEIENLGKLEISEDVLGRFKVFLNDREQTKVSKKIF